MMYNYQKRDRQALVELRLSRAMSELTLTDLILQKWKEKAQDCIHNKLNSITTPKQWSAPRLVRNFKGWKTNTKEPPRANAQLKRKKDKAWKMASTGKRCATPKLY